MKALQRSYTNLVGSCAMVRLHGQSRWCLLLVGNTLAADGVLDVCVLVRVSGSLMAIRCGTTP
jgi:hypothetical protein